VGICDLRCLVFVLICCACAYLFIYSTITHINSLFKSTIRLEVVMIVVVVVVVNSTKPHAPSRGASKAYKLETQTGHTLYYGKRKREKGHMRLVGMVRSSIRSSKWRFDAQLLWPCSSRSRREGRGRNGCKSWKMKFEKWSLGAPVFASSRSRLY